MQKLSLCLFLLPLSIFCLHNTADARLNTITGGVTTSYDYDKTNYKRYDEAIESFERRDLVQQISIGPSFIFETTSSTDGVSISFNPSFVYDLEDSQSNINHNSSFTAFRDFTRQFRAELTDNFLYSDDPQLLEAENPSDYNRGRRRYWTNTFNINSNYSYDAGSSFGAGYSYEILRNDDTGIGGYEDYDRHTLDLSLQHRFNASWNASLFTNYSRGLFDPPEQNLVDRTEEALEELFPGVTDNIDTENLSNDLSEYELGGTLNWVESSRKTFFANYIFSITDYDAVLRRDTNLHNLTLGAHYQYSRRLSFDVGAGPSYEKTETFDANWGYNGHFNLNYDVAQHTSMAAGVEKGYDQRNFSANNSLLGRDEGLTEFWNYSIDFSHQFSADLTGTLFGTYRDETQENTIHGFVNALETGENLNSVDQETFREESRFKREIYETGATLSYTFLQWYTTTISYTYRNQESERINDTYDEHRMFLTLSFQKELFRW